MANRQAMPHFVLLGIQISSLLLCATSINTTQMLNGLTLNMIHRDSPNSPMYRPNLTDNDRMKKYIQISKARVLSIAKSYSRNKKSLRSFHSDYVIVRPTISVQATQMMYLVQVGIGTFGDSPNGKQYYLLLDTGSDLIWTQCEDCYNQCYHQVEPRYPASQSSTYKAFGCDNCPSGGTCHNGAACRFQRTYADDATVIAVAAKEVFTFASEPGRSQPIKDVIFGCGISMVNFKEGSDPNNRVSGIFGMGYGNLGFVEQSDQIFTGKFSYCLQPMFKQGGGGSPMYLRFGNDVIPRQISGMQSTPLYRDQDYPMYYLNLQGISVGNQRLAIPPSSFSIKAYGSGGLIIDTGSGTSWINTITYQPFESAIRMFILSHNPNLQLMEPELGFDSCYERFQDPVNVYLPTIIYHFENNADYVIDVKSAFYIGQNSAGKAMVCLEFFESTTQSNNQLSYLGALQQENHRFVFDTKNSRLYFAPADCSQGN